MINQIKKEKDISVAIAELEVDKMFQKEQLADSFHQKVESLKPVNLVKSSAGKVMANPNLKKGLLVTAAGIGTILLLKQMTRKKSGGKGLLFMVVSGIGSILLKRMVATGMRKAFNGPHPR